MSNFNDAIIICLVTTIILLLFVYYKHPEAFTMLRTFQSLTPHSIIPAEQKQLVDNDISNMKMIETVDEDLRLQVVDLVDEILDKFNKNYNKQLIRIEIERVDRTVKDNKEHFIVWVFVFNYKKESNAKVMVDFTLENKKNVVVNKVDVLGSNQSVEKTRGGIETREDKNFKEPVDMDKVNSFEPFVLDYQLFNVSETEDKMVDRNSWILHKERKSLGDLKTFPSKKMHTNWDLNGVNYTDADEDGMPGGLNSGSRSLSYVPLFMKHNFELCSGDYLWLFDKSKDVESRPIGVA